MVVCHLQDFPYILSIINRAVGIFHICGANLARTKAVICLYIFNFNDTSFLVFYLLIYTNCVYDTRTRLAFDNPLEKQERKLQSEVWATWSLGDAVSPWEKFGFVKQSDTTWVGIKHVFSIWPIRQFKKFHFCSALEKNGNPTKKTGKLSPLTISRLVYHHHYM